MKLKGVLGSLESVLIPATLLLWASLVQPTLGVTTNQGGEEYVFVLT